MAVVVEGEVTGVVEVVPAARLPSLQRLHVREGQQTCFGETLVSKPLSCIVDLVYSCEMSFNLTNHGRLVVAPTYK